MSSPAGKAGKNPKNAAAKTEREKPARPQGGFLKRNKFHIALFCLVFVVFGNSIYNEYALDDEFYTAGGNKLTQQGIKGIPKIFKTRTFFNNDGSGYSFRPIAVASFALEIQLFGEKPHTSHFINVLIYAFTLVLLFGLLRKWFKAQGDWFAFFVCLLFLVHPIHTEVVDNIKCRDELLAFFFSICTLHFVWQHIETGAHRKWLAITISFACAVMSKTSIAPFFVLIPFSVWYFTDRKWWQAAIYAAPLAVAVIAIKLAFISQVPEMSRTLQGFENPIHDMNFAQLSATAMYVLGRYLLLMFLPHPLIFYYGLNEVPVCSWSNPLIILSLVVYLGLAVWTWTELRKKTISGFGMVFFVANIALFSNLFGAAPGLMAERFAYSASLGIFIVMVDLVFRFSKFNAPAFDWKAESSKRVKWIFIGAAILFSLRSVVRNEAWEDKETLYRNDVELAPESAKMNMLLGSLLSSQAAQLSYEAQRAMQQGNQREAQEKKAQSDALFKEAREYYKQATVVFPDYYTAWSNLGTAYYFTHEYRNGIPYFKRAVAIKSDYAEGYFNLGMSYEQVAMGGADGTDPALLDSSIYFFRKAIESNPKYVPSYEQLGRIYFQHKHDSAGAIQLLQKAAVDNPQSDVPWNAMSTIYLKSRDTANAVYVLEKAASIEPNNVQRLQNLYAYFSMHGNMEKANYYGNLFREKQAELEKQQKLLGKDKGGQPR